MLLRKDYVPIMDKSESLVLGLESNQQDNLYFIRTKLVGSGGIEPNR